MAIWITRFGLQTKLVRLNPHRWTELVQTPESRMQNQWVLFTASVHRDDLFSSYVLTVLSRWLVKKYVYSNKAAAWKLILYHKLKDEGPNSKPSALCVGPPAMSYSKLTNASVPLIRWKNIYTAMMQLRNLCFTIKFTGRVRCKLKLINYMFFCTDYYSIVGIINFVIFLPFINDISTFYIHHLQC